VLLAAILGGLVGFSLGLLAIGFSGLPEPEKWWHMGWLPHRLVSRLAALGAMVGAGVAHWATRPKVA
jgi:hypothetical protein